ncbi:MAG: hypothetical protein K8S55_01355 [Phycisphaerae bacterium]|nr:hypothetical protein [Phycisphaerae bacterium]
MAQKFKLTRPELKRYRDALQRFQRYLPMLKLKQQQLQLMVRNVTQEMNLCRDETRTARETFEPYQAILTDRAGVNFKALATPAKIDTEIENVASAAWSFPSPCTASSRRPPGWTRHWPTTANSTNFRRNWMFCGSNSNCCKRNLSRLSSG